MFNFVHPAVGSNPLRWKGWREDLRSVVMKPTISGAPDLPLPVRAITEAGGIKIQVCIGCRRRICLDFQVDKENLFCTSVPVF